jgi:tripeptide aminopeptidase
MKNNQVLDTFIDLVKIPSPSGEEANVAAYVGKKLAESGFLVWKDETGKQNNSNTGNLYAYLEIDKSWPTLAFSAHLDTVEKPGETIVPKVVDGVVSSDGKTILGSDNKGSVAILIELAKILKNKPLKYNILFFFPTREEAGLMGSSFFKFDGPKIKYFFNLDSSDVPGVFIYKSLGYLNFKITVKGLSAHAAKSYEKGIDAIKAAGVLLTRLPIGKKIEEGWTLNIGKISGGNSTNVVCDQVDLMGELRAFDDSVFTKMKKKIREIGEEVALITNSTIELIEEVSSYIPPFKGKATGELIDLCKKATEEVGLKWVITKSFSTSDSNFYSAKGYLVVTVSKGGESAHSVNEKIKVSHLDDTIRLIISIIDLA